MESEPKVMQNENDLKKEYQEYLEYEDYLKKDDLSNRERLGPVGTFGATAADEFLMNYGAEALAAAKAPFSQKPLKEAYVGERDALEKQLNESQELNPTASMAGTAAGVGGSLLVPMPAMQGSRVAKGLKSAAMGVAQFLGQDTGSIEGEVMTPPEVAMQKVDLVEQNPWMAAISTVVPAGLEMSPIKKVGSEIVAGTVAPNLKQAKKMVKAEESGVGLTQAELGKYMIDSGIAKPFTSTNGMFSRSARKLDEIGGRIGDLIKNKGSETEAYLINNIGKIKGDFFDKVVGPENAVKIIDRVYSKIEDFPEADSAIKYVADFLNRKTRKGSLSLPELQQMRVSINNAINFNKEVPDFTFKEKALLELKNIIDEAVESEFDIVEKVSKGSDLKKLKEYRDEYHKLSVINDNALRKEAKKMSTTQSIGLPASIGAAAGGSTGSMSRAAIGAGIGATSGLINNMIQSGRMQTAVGNVLSSPRITNAPAALGSRLTPEQNMSEMSALQRYRLQKQLNKNQGGL